MIDDFVKRQDAYQLERLRMFREAYIATLRALERADFMRFGKDDTTDACATARYTATRAVLDFDERSAAPKP